MATDTWFSTDLPVLDAAVDLFKNQPVSADAIAEVTALEVETVGLALSRLDGSFLRVEVPGGGWQYAWVDEVYPDARRAVGQWPSAEVLAARILAQLKQDADDEPDPAKKSKLRALAVAAGEVGTNAVGGIIAAAASYGVGIG